MSLKISFDGVEINWMYPAVADKNGRCEDKDNFVKLIKELRAALVRNGLLLSAALSPIKEIVDDGYDIAELNANLDFIHVLGYNLRSPMSDMVDHHSSVSRRPHDEGQNIIRNLEYGIRFLKDKGADPAKLILGVPFFGVSFTLVNPIEHEPGSAAKGPGLPGKYTVKEGFLAYYEICPSLIDGTLKVARDEYGQVPHAYGQGQWVGYDDEESIENKMKFIKKHDLAGAGLWALDLDDYHGMCGPKNPLLRKVYSELCGEDQAPVATKYNEAMRQAVASYPYGAFRPQIPAAGDGPMFMSIKLPFTPIHTQPAIEVRAALYLEKNICDEMGFLRDPADCSRFFRCDNGLLRQFACPFGLRYNHVTYTCDWAHYAGCDTYSDPEGGAEGGSSDQFTCQGDGLYPNPKDCKTYYICAQGEPILMECFAGTLFNPNSKLCDWAQNVRCDRTEQPGPGPAPGPVEPVTRPTEPTTTRRAWPPTRRWPGSEWEGTVRTTQPTTRFRPWVPQTTTTFRPWVEQTTSRTTTFPPWVRQTTTRRTTTFRPWVPQTTTTFRPWGPQTTKATSARPTDAPAVLPPGMTDNYKVVCYFTNWSWYRRGIGKYLPENVDTALCTHVIYAFTVLDSEKLTIKYHDPWADIDNKMLARVVDLKKKNPKLKVILGLGGWTDSAGDKYSRLVNNPASRAKFIQHALQFINNYGFDGLDFDWEYPKCWQVDCKRGPDSDKQGFAAMLTELRAAFDSNTPRLLLTAAVSPSKKVIDAGYDVPVLARTLDFVNVMTYDYHGSWEKKTGHVAPMYYFPGDEFDNFNSNFTLNYFMEMGVPREKIIMGMPMYGQTWTLADTNEHGLNSPTYGPGEAGQYSMQRGMIAYYEICSRLRGDGWSVVRDPHGRIGPFAFKGNQWMSFDDMEMIHLKATFVRNHRLGGAMIWALDFDDFNNVCCKEANPLLKTINRVLRNYPAAPSHDECRAQQYLALDDTEPVPAHVQNMCLTSRCA